MFATLEIKQKNSNSMKKHELFDTKEQELSRIFRALAHPARIAILKHIAQSSSCISGDISEAMPLSRTTVSQHLTELREAELITGTYAGTKIYYCLNTKKIKEIRKIADIFWNIIDNDNY